MNADESLEWQDVLAAHPGSEEGEFNTGRKALLKPGVFIVLPVATAVSWVWGFRDKMKAAGIPTHITAPELKGLDSVRVTILEVPDETKADPVDGKILVEVDGVQGRIEASVFYNCTGRARPGGHFCSGRYFGPR